jgi:hypothetical protein
MRALVNAISSLTPFAFASSCTPARHLRNRCRNPGSVSQIVMLLSIESKLLHFLIFDCIFNALSLHNAGPGRAISGGFL